MEKNSTVFDEYQDGPSTKDHYHAQRASNQMEKVP